MVYDSTHNVDVLFGGTSGINNFDPNDTWTWNGLSWTKMSPTTSPTCCRDSGEMAFDPAIGKAVYFGGDGSGANSLGDTWTWDGSNWAQVTSSPSPPARESASMDYDPTLGKIVLFGGVQLVNGNVNQVFDDTWTFDGTNWVQLAPSNSPGARDGQAMAWDPGISQMVLFGGLPAGSGNDDNDTWSFNGTNWTQLSPSNPPPARQNVGFAWDPTLSVMLLYGGFSNGTGVDYGDEWAFDGTNWEQGAAYMSGGPRQWPNMVQQPSGANGQMFLYGGATASMDYGDANVIDYVGVGERKGYSLDTKSIDDRSSVSVNRSSRDLIVDATDLSYNSASHNLVISRSYNLREGGTFTLGPDWTFNIGADVFTSALQNGGEVVFGLSQGDQQYFAKTSNTCNGTGTVAYTAPPGVDADLCKQTTGILTLTFHSTQEKLTFNTSGQETSDTDRNGNSTTISYNTDGTTHTITDTEGRVTTFTYTSGQLTKITDAFSRTYQYGYTSGMLTSYTDANGKVTSYKYDSQDELIQITDPDGHVVAMTFNSGDDIGSVNSVTLGSGTSLAAIWTYQQQDRDQTVSGSFEDTVVTDPNNNSTTYVLSYFDEALKVTDPLGHVQSSTYTADNNPATLTDALSSVYTLSYNTSNDLDQIQAPASAGGQTSASAYGSFATPAGPAGYQYLASSMSDPQGNCDSYLYDTSGNLTDTYGGLSANSSHNCDGQTGSNHTVSAYQGDGSTTCGGLAGQMCSSTDAKGNKTSYSYGGSHNLTSITPPSPLGATTITWNGGEIQSVTDGKSQKTSYTLDKLNRITQILFGGATTCSPSTGNCIQYTYDADGNLTQRVDNTGTTTFAYDVLNRLTDKGTPSGADACSGSSPAGITYTYDAASNILTSCDANGTTNYGYDAANRLTSMAEPGGSCTGTVSLCTTFSYDNDNRRTGTTLPGGATETVGYLPSGLITSVVGENSSSTVESSFSYTYNKSTSDTSLAQTRAESDPLASNTYSYSYDAFDRLTAATITAGSGTSYSYAYDADGNRCANASNCNSPTFTYNAANELTSGPAGSYGYDADGNETSSPQLSNLSYNTKNQTSSITPSGGSAQSMAYADVGSLERTADGSTTLVSGAFGVDRSTTSGTSTYYIRDNSGNLLGEVVAGSHYYFLHDSLGSVVAVINGSGTVSDRFAYDPYGGETTATGSITDPFQYVGGYFDSTTGLTKFGTRYYDPATGRWTQQDPFAGAIVGPQSLDRYTYTEDNPVNKTDPTGECSFWGCIGGAFETGFGLLLGTVATATVQPELYPFAVGFVYNGYCNAGGVLICS